MPIEKTNLGEYIRNKRTPMDIDGLQEVEKNINEQLDKVTLLIDNQLYADCSSEDLTSSLSYQINSVRDLLGDLSNRMSDLIDEIRLEQ